MTIFHSTDIKNSFKQWIRSKLSVFTPKVRTDLEGYNWDNCNPATNGEYFLIKRCAKEWNICFDIGANTGEYSAYILKTNPDCKVFCFEPNILLRDFLEEKKVTDICHVALGDRCGTVLINIDMSDSSQSSIYRNNKQCKPQEVPMITIDYYMSSRGIDYVSFIKIDTEGNELAVLRGASVAIKNQSIGMIQFEYGGTYSDAGTTLRQVYETLSKNYLICHLFPHGLLPVPYSNELETFRYSNWIAVSRQIYTCCSG